MSSEIELYLSIYKRKKTKIYIIIGISITIVLAVFALKIIYGFDLFVWGMVSMAISAFTQVITLSIWNCPSCGRSLGLNYSKKVCGHCGVIFNDVGKDELEIEDLYESYSGTKNRIDPESSTKVIIELKNRLGFKENDSITLDDAYNKYIDDKYSLPVLDEESKSIVSGLRWFQLLLVIAIVGIGYFYPVEFKYRNLAFGLVGILTLIEYIKSRITKTIPFPRYSVEEKKDEYEFYAGQMVMLWSFIIFEIIFVIGVLW